VKVTRELRKLLGGIPDFKQLTGFDGSKYLKDAMVATPKDKEMLRGVRRHLKDMELEPANKSSYARMSEKYNTAVRELGEGMPYDPGEGTRQLKLANKRAFKRGAKQLGKSLIPSAILMGLSGDVHSLDPFDSTPIDTDPIEENIFNRAEFNRMHPDSQYSYDQLVGSAKEAGEEAANTSRYKRLVDTIR